MDTNSGVSVDQNLAFADNEPRTSGKIGAIVDTDKKRLIVKLRISPVRLANCLSSEKNKLRSSRQITRPACGSWAGSDGADGQPLESSNDDNDSIRTVETPERSDDVAGKYVVRHDGYGFIPKSRVPPSPPKDLASQLQDALKEEPSDCNAYFDVLEWAFEGFKRGEQEGPDLQLYYGKNGNLTVDSDGWELYRTIDVDRVKHGVEQLKAEAMVKEGELEKRWKKIRRTRWVAMET